MLGAKNPVKSRFFEFNYDKNRPNYDKNRPNYDKNRPLTMTKTDLTMTFDKIMSFL